MYGYRIWELCIYSENRWCLSTMTRNDEWSSLHICPIYRDFSRLIPAKIVGTRDNTQTIPCCYLQLELIPRNESQHWPGAGGWVARRDFTGIVDTAPYSDLCHLCSLFSLICSQEEARRERSSQHGGEGILYAILSFAVHSIGTDCMEAIKTSSLSGANDDEKGWVYLKKMYLICHMHCYVSIVEKALEWLSTEILHKIFEKEPALGIFFFCVHFTPE